MICENSYLRAELQMGLGQMGCDNFDWNSCAVKYEPVRKGFGILKLLNL